MNTRKGKVYLVGAGPGDPGLVTLKAIDAIAEADCIVYDFLANSSLLEYARKNTEIIYAGKKGGDKTLPQEEINRLIIQRALEGKTVVRLKGGDPFIFGRGGEEAEELAEYDIPFEVIPGVSSATAVPAYAGIPLTHRDLSSSVTIITGQEAPLKERPNIAWDRLSVGRGTLVFVMGWKNLSFIVERLLENGWSPSTPVAVIRWGTLTKQITVTGTLMNICDLVKQKDIKPPVVTVVGDVVALRERLNWFEKKPLFGWRVLVTRAQEQAGELVRVLKRYGAEPVVIPTIKITPPPSWNAIDRAIRRLSTYDWIIFTSVNGVRYFFERLYTLGKDIRDLKGINICTIGPKTEGALRKRGIRVELVPGDYRAEGVIEVLKRKRIRGQRFLLPRAEKAREILPEEIRRLGGRIDVVPVYRTVMPRKEGERIRELLREGRIDCVTFTSSSTVNNLARMLGKKRIKELLSGVCIACIGPITASTVRGLGMDVDIVPQEYTIEAMVEAMAEWRAVPLK